VQLYAPPRRAETLPVIDLSLPDTVIAAAIREACLDTGFFYVINHGVKPELVAGQFEAARRILAVSEAEKRALHMRNSSANAGYEPIGGQVLDSQDPGAEPAPPDLKESFYCTTNLIDENPDARAPTTGTGPNQWPAGLEAWRRQSLAYGEAVQALGDRLLRYIAMSLGLSANWFEPFYVGASGRLRMLRYPPQPDAAAHNQIGAGAHTDWGGITILAQDAIGGLEVRNRRGEWIAAEPVAGSFVINLGDLMARWTNGLYASNMHRVRNNDSAQDRYSAPFFYSPHADSVIEPIASCVSADNPPRFATCTAGEHFREMFRRSYGY
jgi:isopenicillin N synthase-like dioxygenase